jgi:hypothetical protein
VLVTSLFRRSAGGRNRLIGGVMGGLPGAPEGGSGGGVVLEDVGRLTRLFPSGLGRTRGAPGDDGPCLGHCCWGNI